MVVLMDGLQAGNVTPHQTQPAGIGQLTGDLLEAKFHQLFAAVGKFGLDLIHRKFANFCRFHTCSPATRSWRAMILVRIENL